MPALRWKRDRFRGFRRGDGQVGIRNHVLVLGVNGLVMRAAERIAQLTAETVCVATPYGRSHVGDDHEVQFRHLIGLGNPVVGAAVDMLVDCGATVLVGETVEWLGAEHLLAARARSHAVVNPDEDHYEAFR